MKVIQALNLDLEMLTRKVLEVPTFERFPVHIFDLQFNEHSNASSNVSPQYLVSTLRMLCSTQPRS